MGPKIQYCVKFNGTRDSFDPKWVVVVVGSGGKYRNMMFELFPTKEEAVRSAVHEAKEEYEEFGYWTRVVISNKKNESKRFLDFGRGRLEVSLPLPALRGLEAVFGPSLTL